MNSNTIGNVFTGYSKPSYRSATGISGRSLPFARNDQYMTAASTMAVDMFSKSNEGFFELNNTLFQQNEISTPMKMEKLHNQFNHEALTQQQQSLVATVTSPNQSVISVQIPRILESEVTWRRSISTNLPYDLINKKINKIFQDNGIVDITSCSPFEIEGRYFSSNYQMATFIIRIYQNRNDNSVRIVEFNRDSGYGEMIFQEFLAIMVNGMSDNIIKTEISNESQSWIPLPLITPLLPFSELPLLPEISELPPLPPLTNLNLDNESVTSQMTDLDYINDLILQCEDGFAHEIEMAAPTLVSESKKSHFLQQLYQIDNIVTRFLNIFEKSNDVLLVRSLLIVLSNMLLAEPQFYSENYNGHNLYENLKKLETRWSNNIKPFSECDITINKSFEICTQINAICEQIYC